MELRLLRTGENNIGSPKLADLELYFTSGALKELLVHFTQTEEDFKPIFL